MSPTNITGIELPHHYAASIISSQGVNTVGDEIQPVDERDAVEVVYEETYAGRRL